MEVRTRRRIDDRGMFQLQLPRVSYHDGHFGVAAGLTLGFNGPDNIHALDNTAKDYMLVVQPSGLDSANEEL